jgi:hypothetical protein
LRQGHSWRKIKERAGCAGHISRGGGKPTAGYGKEPEMWERFELFWTAFEKFALFFSFVGTLVALVIVGLLYGAVHDLKLPPPPTPVPTPPVEPMVQSMLEGFEKIQGAVSPATVPISYTVPVTLDIRIHPDATRLELVDKSEIKTGRIVINLGEAGDLIGKEATVHLGPGNAFQVKLDISKQIVFDVPVRVDVPIQVPLHVDLSQEITTLENISKTVDIEATAVPGVVRQAP